MILIWAQDGKHWTDTIHVAECAHLHLRRAPEMPLEATDPEQAKAEIAYAMGWADYPEDADGIGFDINVAPCVKNALA